MNARNRNRILAAVAAALPMLAVASSSPAQQRVNQDGRALDANTRVGSDGSNDKRNTQDRSGQTYTGNQLVTGNVSGSRAFRGPVGYRDPNEFSGPIAGRSSDRLVRDSARAPTRSNPNVDYGAATGYYGAGRTTPLPQGYRPEGFSGGYFATGAASQTSTYRSPYQQSTANVFDSQNAMLRPGSLVLDAGRDDKNQPTVLTASPLTGVLRLDPSLLGNGNDSVGVARSITRNGSTPADRAGLTPADVTRMRQELNDAGQDGGQSDAAQADPNAVSNAIDSKPLDNTVGGRGESVDSARAAGINARNQGTSGAPDATAPTNTNQLDNRVKAGTVDGRSLQTSQGLDRRMTVPPSKQSKLYAELQQRFEQARGEGQTGAEDSQRDLRLLRTAQQGAEPKPGDPQPNAADGAPDAARPLLPVTPRKGAVGARRGDPKPEAPAPANPADAAKVPASAKPDPVRIKSLAEGVQAKGLHDLLAGAEDLMRAGKFTSAIEKYAAAEQVAPNNPMIRLGRAQAELGTTRYGSAEKNLRQAVAADPALLMGKYDLEAFMGRERLVFIVQDLKQAAASEPTAARPMILLAYIAYGMPDQEAAAADYLDQAAKRSGRPDSLISAMQKTWKLPEATEAAPDAQPKEATPEPKADEAQPKDAAPAPKEDVNK